MSGSGDHLRVAMSVGGVIGVMLVVSLQASGVIDVDGWWDDRGWPAWVNLVPLPLIVGYMLVLAHRAQAWGLRFVAFAVVPLAIGTYGVRAAEPDPTWATVIRGSAIALIFAVSVISALYYASSSYRELEKLLFTGSTSAAFFVTLAGVGGYAAAQTFTDLPDISLAWVVLFALASWAIAAIVFSRRYT